MKKIGTLIFAALATLSGFGFAEAGADMEHADDRAISQSGDPKRGKAAFHRCQLCHRLNGSAAGPDLSGLFGRKVGTLTGYSGYSAALRQADFIWTEQRLDEWLANPRGFLPGNKMAFPGVSDAGERADLIAYLRAAGNPPVLE